MEQQQQQQWQRGRSAEVSDARRVNAVSPMHFDANFERNIEGGGRMLQSLWHEAHSTHSLHNAEDDAAAPPPPLSNDMKLKAMLDKYQSQVMQQQQQKTPAYEKRAHPSASSSKSGSTPSMSHSQPCLIAITDRNDNPLMSTSTMSASHYHPSSMDQREQMGGGGGVGGGQGSLGAHSTHSTVAMAAERPGPAKTNQKLIASLREENLHLKQQIEQLSAKAGRVGQLEKLQQQLELEYEQLMRERERHEQMEKAVRAGLEERVKRLVSEKEQLIAQLEHAQGQQAPSHQHHMSGEQLLALHRMVAELVPQNKDLLSCVERQRVEMEAQAATLDEQRTHIAMLEKALACAQDRLHRKDKMLEELSSSAQRADHLQRQLYDALRDKQNRDETHAAERAQLEMEVAGMKIALNKQDSVGLSLKKPSPREAADADQLQRMKKAMAAKDERILQLERASMELERRVHEEAERKRNALSQLTESLEGKIRKLEDEKSERDRRIAILTEEKCRLLEDESIRTLDRMELMRLKIQERKMKGAGQTAGPGAVNSPDHMRTSSSSSSLPRRPSFDPLIDSASLLLQARSPYSTLLKSEKEDDAGGNVWNV